MRQIFIVLSLFAFAGCATNGASQNVKNQIDTELDAEDLKKVCSVMWC